MDKVLDGVMNDYIEDGGDDMSCVVNTNISRTTPSSYWFVW